MKIQVSVVIPIYNVSDYLTKCLDSIGNDALHECIEVILVNDGSTDNSLDYCKAFASKYSNVIIIDKSNGGLSDARNAGLEIATGEYIMFVDSDDWLMPNAIVKLLDKAIDYDLDIIQAGYFYAYPNYMLAHRDFLSKEFNIIERDEAMAGLVDNIIIKNFAWGKLYKRTVINNIKFMKGVYFEDSFWQHQIINNTRKYGILNEPLYCYTQRPTSISGRFSKRNFDLIRGNLERFDFICTYYPDLQGKMFKRLENLYWQAYGCCKSDPALKKIFNELILQFNDMTSSFTGFRKFILNKFKIAYVPFSLIERVANHIRKDQYIILKSYEG